jgi:hypothetical protein
MLDNVHAFKGFYLLMLVLVITAHSPSSTTVRTLL